MDPDVVSPALTSTTIATKLDALVAPISKEQKKSP